MKGKSIGFYLNLFAASLGASIFLKSMWYLINAAIREGSPLSGAFWDRFFADFHFMSLSTLVLLSLVFTVLLLTLSMAKNTKESA